VALLLHRRGITRVRPLEGGFGGWVERGLPLDAHAPIPVTAGSGA
jgi:3-mercaptopyruvate sulfurtransferase SseA